MDYHLEMRSVNGVVKYFIVDSNDVVDASFDKLPDAKAHLDRLMDCHTMSKTLKQRKTSFKA
jgi:uncharacterized protein with HEPN domain